MESVELADETQIGRFQWPDSKSADQAKRFILPMMKMGIPSFFDNMDASVLALRVDDIVIPVVLIRASGQDSSYVVSPYNQFVSYTQEEIDRLPLGIFKPIFRGLVGAAGRFLGRARLDSCVFVNNWLQSTNFHPPFNEAQLGAITARLTDRYPDKAIVFRSVNVFEGAGYLKAALEKNGYQSIVNRRIYVQDPALAKDKKAFKEDHRALKKTDYTVVRNEDILPSDYGRIVQLYNLLYVEKYSRYNPILNHNFVEMAHVSGLVQFTGLRKNGRLDAIFGFFYGNEFMSVPWLGYDTSLPRSIALYRMIFQLITQQASEKGVRFHMSSGVGNFKRLRGGVPSLEYLSVYARHLPYAGRLSWTFLQKLMNYVARPVMLRLEL